MTLAQFRPLALGVALLGLAQFAAADPPYRVARISDVSGAVSFRPASSDDWSVASRNYPLTVGDQIWTDRGGRAELALGSSFVRISQSTDFSLLNLDDRFAQLRITQGTLVVHVRDLTDSGVEVDTPVGAVTIDQPGSYRIDVDDADGRTTITVRRGLAEVATNGAAYTVDSGHSIVVGDGPSAYTMAGARNIDDFETWCQGRDRRVDSSASLKYVSPGLIGYEDLDEYGTWQDAPGYGQTWYPRAAADWAPYRFGHWAWINPWGWTWIDDQPWGFAPSHYGRWSHSPRGWGWTPGNAGSRPVYAPALVAFVGGTGWTASFGVGLAPVGWFPLAPREPYAPAYSVSPGYLRAVNAPYVDVQASINVGSVRYANRDVPGAFTAVPRDAFGRGRAINAAVVSVPRDVVMRAAPTQPGPGRPSSVELVAGNRRGTGAPAASMNRRVVVKQDPPADSKAMVRSAPRMNAPARSAPVRLEPSPQRGQPPQERGTQAPRQAPQERAAPAPRQAPQERAAPPPRQAPQERAAPPPRPAPQEHAAPSPRQAPQERAAPPPRQAPQERAAPPPRQAPQERAAPPPRQAPQERAAPPPRQAPQERAAPPPRQAPQERAAPPPPRQAPQERGAPPPKGGGEDNQKKDKDKK